jgi:hypothetical protein
LTARSGDLGAQQSDDILGFHYFHKDESEFSLQAVNEPRAGAVPTLLDFLADIELTRSGHTPRPTWVSVRLLVSTEVSLAGGNREETRPGTTDVILWGAHQERSAGKTVPVDLVSIDIDQRAPIDPMDNFS